MTSQLGITGLPLVTNVLRKLPAVEKAVVFGSRAKGTHRIYSDVDVALFGSLGFLDAERVARELDELPLIYTFDVLAYNQISNLQLKEHIDRVGIVIYIREGCEAASNDLMV